MAESVDIFISSFSSLDKLALDISQLIGLELRPLSNRESVWYVFYDSYITIEIGGHDYKNDRDMKFEDYCYDISIMAVGDGDEIQRKRRRDEYANHIFLRLAETNQYRLLMVEALQTKLMEFDPVG